MIDDAPFALFLTWTCYGTWLPGDERGHVSNTLLRNHGYVPKQNVPGTPYAKGDKYTHERAKSLQNWPSVYLNRPQALWAAESFVLTARKNKWRILRAAIMANHVHLVVVDCPDEGAAVRRVFKGASQAAMSEKLGQSRRWWTAGGSDHYLHTDDAIEGTVWYVAEQQWKLAEIIDMKMVALE